MKDYDAYLFDWDGTLAQTLAIWLPLVKELLEPYGIPSSDKVIIRQVFGRPRQGFEELGVPEGEIDGMLERLVVEAQLHIPKAPLYPGVHEVLDHLRREGKQLALITASSHLVIDKTLHHHKLQKVFDVVVTGSDISRHKPDPEGILRVLQELHTDKEKAVMLGDSEKDILAAHNAGVDSVLFYPSEHDLFHTFEELTAEKPTYVIRSWKELLDQVQ